MYRPAPRGSGAAARAPRATHSPCHSHAPTYAHACTRPVHVRTHTCVTHATHASTHTRAQLHQVLCVGSRIVKPNTDTIADGYRLTFLKFDIFRVAIELGYQVRFAHSARACAHLARTATLPARHGEELRAGRAFTLSQCICCRAQPTFLDSDIAITGSLPTALDRLNMHDLYIALGGGTHCCKVRGHRLEPRMRYPYANAT